MKLVCKCGNAWRTGSDEGRNCPICHRQGLEGTEYQFKRRIYPGTGENTVVHPSPYGYIPMTSDGLGGKVRKARIGGLD